MPTPHRIDTHHHIYPPKFMAENVEHKIDGAAMGWTPRYSLDQMDQNGVATAIGAAATTTIAARRRRSFLIARLPTNRVQPP